MLSGRSRIASLCCAVAAALMLALVCALAMPQPVSAAGLHPYFGDLHNHTRDSNAMGTPAAAYAAAAAAGADFLAVTDHSEWFGADVWEVQCQAAQAATTSTFVALNGLEVTMGWGHLNVWNAGVLPSAAEYAVMTAGDATTVYDWMLAHPGSLGQWNHPTHKSDNFAAFAGLTPERRTVMAAIEVANETYRYEPSYISALDKGWRVMPTANGDVHNAKWITGYPNRTVLLAPQLTKADLLEALAARRGYATVDSDLSVSFIGNGAIMGSTLAQPSTIRFEIRVNDPKPRVRRERVRWLTIVSDAGKVVAVRRCNGFLVKWRPKLKTAGAHYYYLRVGNNSGRVAWTAPIWTGLPY